MFMSNFFSFPFTKKVSASKNGRAGLPPHIAKIDFSSSEGIAQYFVDYGCKLIVENKTDLSQYFFDRITEQGDIVSTGGSKAQKEKYRDCLEKTIQEIKPKYPDIAEKYGQILSNFCKQSKLSPAQPNKDLPKNRG